MRLTLLLFSLVVLLASCDRPRLYYETKGADEFVIDSCRIKQGKYAIWEMQGINVCPLPRDCMCEYRDAIDEGDLLKITVYHHGRKDLCQIVRELEHSVGYRVRDGVCTLPELHPIKVVGLTLTEARLLIESEYRRHVDDIEVFIDYAERQHKVVELIGLIEVPVIPVDGRIRLFDVLARARMAPHANLFMSHVVRGGCVLPVDLYKLVKEGDMSQNIVMKPQDKIYIAEPLDSKAMVMGEVGCPKVIPLPKGYISLREALVDACGIPYTGDKRCIQVIRGELPCPKVYLLDWYHIIMLPNNSLLLMQGDVVYVLEKPITSWNRFISQLFPTYTGFQIVTDVRKTCVAP